MLVVTARYGEEIGEGPLNKGRDIYESRRTKVTYSPLTNGRTKDWGEDGYTCDAASHLIVLRIRQTVVIF